jgi:hypothetical protein
MHPEEGVISRDSVSVIMVAWIAGGKMKAAPSD